MNAAGTVQVGIRLLLARAVAMRGWKAVLGAAGAIAIAYFLAARLGLALRLARSDVAVFWPASGVATGILIIAGRRAVPAVLIGVVVGTVAAGLTSDTRNLLTSLLNGTWNAGEALLTVWLLERWFGRPFTFGDLRHVAGFLVAAGIATAASAVAGAATLAWLHADTAASYADVWREWFLSGWVGKVVVGPLVIGAAQLWRKPPPREEWIEGMGVLCLTAVACSYTITQATGSWLSFSPAAFVLPLLLWLTARCQPAFGIAGAFVASAEIILATTFGIGRFGDAAVPVAHRVAGAQLAMMTVTLFTLVLAVLFTQRKEVEGRLARERAMLARLHDVGTRLWLKRDLPKALDEILAGAIELLGADKGIIRIFDPTRGMLKIEAHRGFTQEFIDSFREVSAVIDSPCGRTLRSGQRIVIEDVAEDKLFTPFRPRARSAGVRAVQSTPIMSRDRAPLGTLTTHFHLVYKPAEHDLRLLDLYVRQASEIIERHRAEDALRESEERLRLAQLKTGVGIWDWNLRTGKLAWTPELEVLFGLEPGTVKSYSDFRDRVHPDDIGMVEAKGNAALRERKTFEFECRIVRADNEMRWIWASGGALYDEATGEAIRMLGNHVDITERKQAEEARRLLNAELDHRVKNALATVSAVVSRTREASLSADDFIAALEGRLRSMATAHELLSARQWQGLWLTELIRRELAPYSTRDNTEIDGPGILLKPEAGQALAMVLHELATNAAKYGALSTKEGRVSIRWDRQLNGQPRSRLVLEWQEIGGPPIVAPGASSYGTSTIRDLIPYELGGTVNLVFAPEGARCRLELPADCLGQ